MTWSKGTPGREVAHRDREPLGGSWAVSDPVGMASVEPLSLKGSTRKGGKGGAIIFRNGTDGWGGTGEGGQVWNSLQVERGGTGPGRPLPT